MLNVLLKGENIENLLNLIKTSKVKRFFTLFCPDNRGWSLWHQVLVSGKAVVGEDQHRPRWSSE